MRLPDDAAGYTTIECTYTMGRKPSIEIGCLIWPHYTHYTIQRGTCTTWTMVGKTVVRGIVLVAAANHYWTPPAWAKTRWQAAVLVNGAFMGADKALCSVPIQ